MYMYVVFCTAAAHAPLGTLCGPFNDSHNHYGVSKLDTIKTLLKWIILSTIKSAFEIFYDPSKKFLLSHGLLQPNLLTS